MLNKLNDGVQERLNGFWLKLECSFCLWVQIWASILYLNESVVGWRRDLSNPDSDNQVKTQLQMLFFAVVLAEPAASQLHCWTEALHFLFSHVIC